jgi:hypothetical protein
MVCRFMSEHRDEYTIREMAGVFGVSSGASYKWAGKEEVSVGGKEAGAELVGLVRLIQERHHYRYGAPG